MAGSTGQILPSYREVLGIILFSLCLKLLSKECHVSSKFRNSLFVSSSKISFKKHSCKIIFVQSKLNKNNFTSRAWWALIEEIAQHAEEMAGGKEIACCVRGDHVYLDIWAAAI